MPVRRMLVLLAGLSAAALLTGCGTSSVGGGQVGAAPCRWSRERVPHTTEDLDDLSFPDDRHGWAVGGYDAPVIRTTSDGGRSWHRQRGPGTEGLAAVSFPDDRHGWAVGIADVVLATADGGRHWSVQPTPLSTHGDLFAVDFVDARHGWAVGGGGRIIATSDGGRSWRTQDSGTHQSLQSVQFTDAAHGVIQIPGGILTTSDGGAHWMRAYRATGAHGSQIVAGESFLSSQIGWASGSEDDGSANHPVISTTTDGGRRWSTRDLNAFDDVRFGAVDFVDRRHGWVAAYDGDLYYTDDGGLNWADHQVPDGAETIEALQFRGPTHGWAVGQQGVVLGCGG